MRTCNHTRARRNQFSEGLDQENAEKQLTIRRRESRGAVRRMNSGTQQQGNTEILCPQRHRIEIGRSNLAGSFGERGLAYLATGLVKWCTHLGRKLGHAHPVALCLWRVLRAVAR